MTTEFRYISGGATLSYDSAKCVGCGYCAVVCPRGVFRMRPSLPKTAPGTGKTARAEHPGGANARGAHEKAEIVARDLCIECGACMANCPAGAVTVDSGVGCALAIITGWLRGTAPDCGEGCCGEGGCGDSSGGGPASPAKIDSAKGKCCPTK